MIKDIGHEEFEQQSIPWSFARPCVWDACGHWDTTFAVSYADVDAIIDDTLGRWGRKTWEEFLNYYHLPGGMPRGDLVQHIVAYHPGFRSRYDFDCMPELQFGALYRRMRVARHLWRGKERLAKYDVTAEDVLDFMMSGKSTAFRKIPIGEAGLLPLYALPEAVDPDAKRQGWCDPDIDDEALQRWTRGL
jgi:hypothetical protein